MDGIWLLFVYIQFNQSKSKPIQPRNSNLIYIQFPDLKTKRKRKKKKQNKIKTSTLLVMGTRPISLMVADFSLPSPHSVPSLFTILPRFWVCKIVLSNFLISPRAHRLSLFHRLSVFLTQNTNLLIRTKSDPKYQS